MPRYFAFLRAINVGGHTVKMEALRTHFEALGLARVETFIASGNVIFETAGTDTAALERQIEGKLLEELGYPVGTFVRSAAELEAIASLAPFQADDIQATGTSLYVVLLHATSGEADRDRVLALRSEMDDFHIDGREVYWLCRGKISDSPAFARGGFEKSIRSPATSRNINTIERLVAKYCGGPARSGTQT